MPNWLKEEIIKNAITKSSVDHPREEMQSIEDESVGKGDQVDSERMDSPRLTEEEEDDEVLLLNWLMLNLFLIFSFIS